MADVFKALAKEHNTTAKKIEQMFDKAAGQNKPVDPSPNQNQDTEETVTEGQSITLTGKELEAYQEYREMVDGGNYDKGTAISTVCRNSAISSYDMQDIVKLGDSQPELNKTDNLIDELESAGSASKEDDFVNNCMRELFSPDKPANRQTVDMVPMSEFEALQKENQKLNNTIERQAEKNTKLERQVAQLSEQLQEIESYVKKNKHVYDIGIKAIRAAKVSSK